MPTKTKPKRSKRYRPGTVNMQAHLVAIQNACLLSLDDRTRWALTLDAAIQAVRTATATEADWRTLFDAVNLVEQLVLMRLAGDPEGLVQAAQDACEAITNRQLTSGVRAARAAELGALADLRAAWVTLMDGITHAQRFEADEAVARRVRRALAGGLPGARVVEALAP